MKITESQEINLILAKWNPIGVSMNVVGGEYTSYVHKILDVMKSNGDLMECLEGMLVNHLGLEYDRDNQEHVADLRKVYEKLLCVHSHYKS